MSIHIVLGKPGSGKSLYATNRVIRELIETQRNIVTNLPLRPDRLNEYIQQTYPQANTRFVERVRILSDDEISTFWKFRGPGDDPGAQGVAYFLDEAHIAFNARDWANIGRGALHYLSQHRKLGDVVWPITQSPGNLDKQFRSVAEDFTLLRNEYTAKFGPFRGRGRFVRKTYLSEPAANSEPFETASFSLDAKGIASCYDTAKGIGVHGNKADIGRRAKGIPIWWVIPAALVLALGCVFVPYLLGKTVTKVMVAGKTPPVTAGSKPKIAPGGDGLFRPAVVDRSLEIPKVERLKTTSEPIWVEGYVTSGGRINVILSDGRTLTETDPSLERIDRNGVVIDGQKIFMRRARSNSPLVAPALRGGLGGDVDNKEDHAEKRNPDDGAQPSKPVDAGLVTQTAGGADKPANRVEGNEGKESVGMAVGKKRDSHPQSQSNGKAINQRGIQSGHAGLWRAP